MNSEWKEFRLGDLISLRGGLAYKGEHISESGAPMVTMGCVDPGSRFKREGLKYYRGSFGASHTAKAGDIVIATRDVTQKRETIGCPCLIPDDLGSEEVVVATNTYLVRNISNIDNSFLYLLLKSPSYREQIVASAKGSTVVMITKDAIENYSTLLPPPVEQRAIAHILGTLDDKIELNRKTNETLEAMAKALFKSWFVDFDPVRAKAEGRPTGLPDEISELFPDSFEESELGEIPSGWMIESAEKHLELIKGRSYKSAELQESRTALVTLKSFQRGGGYREDGLKPYIGTFKENQVIQPGELIIALTDVTQAADVIGRPAIVRTSEGRETLVASLDVGIIREAKHGLLPQAFVYELFRTEKYVSHALSYTSGTTVLHLAKGVLADFQVVVPPMELIKYFASLSASVLERIDISSQESRSLQKLRDTLLPRLISGELRVPDAEKMLEEAGV